MQIKQYGIKTILAMPSMLIAPDSATEMRSEVHTGAAVELYGGENLIQTCVCISAAVIWRCPRSPFAIRY